MFHAIDEICQYNFFVRDGKIFKMFADNFSKLSFVHARSRRDFIELFIPPKCLHLKFVKVNIDTVNEID